MLNPNLCRKARDPNPLPPLNPDPPKPNSCQPSTLNPKPKSNKRDLNTPKNPKRQNPLSEPLSESSLEPLRNL